MYSKARILYIVLVVGGALLLVLGLQAGVSITPSSRIMNSGFVQGGGVTQAPSGMRLVGRLTIAALTRSEASSGSILTGRVLPLRKEKSSSRHWMLYR